MPLRSPDGAVAANPPGFDRNAVLEQLAVEIPAFFDKLRLLQQPGGGRARGGLPSSSQGDIQSEVIEGVFRVLDEFEAVEQHAQARRALQLDPPEEIAFATAALALRFGERSLEETGGHGPAPVTAAPLIEARRPEDLGHTPVRKNPRLRA
jgi:hypothetical protein